MLFFNYKLSLTLVLLFLSITVYTANDFDKNTILYQQENCWNISNVNQEASNSISIDDRCDTGNVANMKGGSPPQNANLRDFPTEDRFVRPLEIVWPLQANDIDISLWKNDKFAATSISIDDNIVGDHDFWTEMSQLYGWKFTWFIIITSDTLGLGTAQGGEWSDFQILFDQGHDVESHTLTHQNNDHLRPDPEMTIEYRDSIDLLNQNIMGNKAQMIAYPWGNFNRNIAADYAIAGRGVSSGLNKPERTDYFNLNSISANLSNDYLDAVLIGTSGIPWAGDNKYKRGWFSTHYHTVQNQLETEADLANLNLRSDDLWIGLIKEIVKYGQERDTANIAVLTNSTSILEFNLSDEMDDTVFDYPLTLKIKLHSSWNNILAKQNGAVINFNIVTHGGDKFALLQAIPDKGLISIEPCLNSYISQDIIATCATIGDLIFLNDFE